MKKLPTVLSLVSLTTGTFALPQDTEAGRQGKVSESRKNKKRSPRQRFRSEDTLFSRETRQGEKQTSLKRRPPRNLKDKSKAGDTLVLVQGEKKSLVPKKQTEVERLINGFEQKGLKVKKATKETLGLFSVQPGTVMMLTLPAELTPKTLKRFEHVESALTLMTHLAQKNGTHVYALKARNPRLNHESIVFYETLGIQDGSRMEITVNRTIWSQERQMSDFIGK